MTTLFEILDKTGSHRYSFVFIGAGRGSRTPDLRITNALLYQLSYTGVFARREPARGKP